ncbi:MAG TPA: DegT/DnrJ/EryC1/StrS family aminotransferase [Thermomicrobiales bacterium]|jgi:perosamine synthetase|nr:DegT/DnrJ/EryC1/StrS family aminotransferase [Thermomicrobiales bacterium]
MSRIGSVRMDIPLASPWITQEDIDAVVAVLQTPTLSIGPQLRAFEETVAARVGQTHGLGVNSGTSGLHLVLDAMGIGPGDEVITSPFSFVASSNCIIYTGATPVFADIDPQTLAIDPEKLEAAITPRTKAIIPVDVFGQPCPIEAYAEIAQRHGLKIVQDSCEAIGAERHGLPVGGPEYADAAVFAFYPNKQMTTGEGGMIVTSDDELARTIDSLRNQGRDDAGTWMNHVRIGYNYRLDELSAALGLSQVSRLDAILDGRERVARAYTERLADVPGIRVPALDAGTTRMSWFVYVIQLEPGLDRLKVMEALEANGVPSRPYFVPIHLQPVYRERYGFGDGDFPATEAVAETTLAIPFYTTMPDDQIDYVVEQICGAVRA